jgi:hypothetical protein
MNHVANGFPRDLEEHFGEIDKGVKLGRGNKKDGERSADEKRWGMSRAELKKRTAPLQRRHGYSEDWQDARHRDGIGARGSDGAAAPFRRR